MLLPMQQPSAGVDMLPNVLPAALLQPPMLPSMQLPSALPLKSPSLPMQQLPSAHLPNAVAAPLFVTGAPEANAAAAPLFITGAPEDWLQPQSVQHNGLLVKRPFSGAFDEHHPEVDSAMWRFHKSELRLGYGVMRAVKNGNPAELATGLHASIGDLLAEAKLPEPLSRQIYTDACSLGKVVGSM